MLRWEQAFAEVGLTLEPSSSWFADMGGFNQHAYGLPFTTSLPQPEARMVGEVLAAQAPDAEELWFGWSVVREQPSEGGELVETAFGRHVLGSGLLSELVLSGRTFVASLWWPASQQWFLATPTDGVSTYLAGDPSITEAIRVVPSLEVVELSVEDLVVT
jgi:hypothetical protein